MLASAFIFLTTALSVIASPYAECGGGVAAVKADLGVIATDVDNLSAALAAFPATGGTLHEANAVHVLIGNVIPAAINKLSTDIRATGQFNESDALDILNLVGIFGPKDVSNINAIVDKKPAFDALKFSKIIKKDLQFTAPIRTAFANTLIAALPDDLKAGVNASLASVNEIFANALVVYGA